MCIDCMDQMMFLLFRNLILQLMEFCKKQPLLTTQSLPLTNWAFWMSLPVVLQVSTDTVIIQSNNLQCKKLHFKGLLSYLCSECITFLTCSKPSPIGNLLFRNEEIAENCTRHICNNLGKLENLGCQEPERCLGNGM